MRCVPFALPTCRRSAADRLAPYTTAKPSQLAHSLDPSLLVRDVTGDYRAANTDEALRAARRALAGRIPPATNAGIADHAWPLEEIAALVPDPTLKKRGAYKNIFCKEAEG